VGLKLYKLGEKCTGEWMDELRATGVVGVGVAWCQYIPVEVELSLPCRAKVSLLGPLHFAPLILPAVLNEVLPQSPYITTIRYYHSGKLGQWRP